MYNMSNKEEINKITNDPRYLHLKNKVRSTHETREFQKFCRRLDFLRLAQRSTVALPVVPVGKISQKPSRFNQKAKSAWRNQDVHKKPVVYEEKYATYVPKSKTMKF